MDRVTAGAILKRYREERGIPREALSRAAGLSSDGVRKIEASESNNITLDSLFRLCAALGVSPLVVVKDVPPVEGVGVLTEWSKAGRPAKGREKKPD